MGHEDKELSRPEGVTDELRLRRAEAIQTAVRSFAVSRQSLSDGTLSTSERLIRYYEGIAMSLQRAPAVDAYEENVSTFRSVLRYSRHETKVPGDTAGEASADTLDDCDPVLVRQAAYNLAVLHHRRIVQLQTDSQENISGSIYDEKQKNILELYAEARRLYESVITELQEVNHWAGATSPEDMKRVDFATYIAARAGWVLLVVDAYINAAANEKNEYLNASIGNLNLRNYCDETLALLTSVYSQYQSDRTKGTPGRSARESEFPSEAKHSPWILDLLRPLRSKEKQQKDAQVARRRLERNSAPILSALLWQLNAAKEHIPDAHKDLVP